MNFVAIDFETANESRNSICALGIAVVTQGILTESQYYLIKPAKLYFNPYNVMIHGITEKDVIDQPTFQELWPTIEKTLGNNFLIAHNAAFDMSVLRYTLDHYEIPYPKVDYSCTWVISKKVWTHQANYRLNHLCHHFGISLDHHNAESDARACAQIAIKAAHEINAVSLYHLADKLQITHGQLFSNGYRPCSSRTSKKTVQSTRSVRSTR